MIRRVLLALVLVPLAASLVALAVANRHPVRIVLDPLAAPDQAYAVQLPLFVLGFVLVLAGVLAGGIATWLRQRKWRRAARSADLDMRVLRAELEGMRRRSAAAQPSRSTQLIRHPAA